MHLPSCLRKIRKGYRIQGGHSLVEVTLALGLVSSGLLALAPLMTLSLQQSRHAQDTQMSAQIAETFLDEAQQGILPAGVYTLDQEGMRCPAAQASYHVTVKTSVTATAATRVSLLIVPVASPKSAISYAALIRPN